MENWLDYTDLDYEARAARADYVADHLDGSLVETDKISKYLVRRQQAESDDIYAERKNILDHTPHYARAVLSLCGMLWAADPAKERRRWGGLGDPGEEGTIAHRLMMDADGEGTNYDVAWAVATVELLAHKRLYALVDGPRRGADGAPAGGATFRFLTPQAVPRLIYDEAGRLVSAKVKTSREVTHSQEEKAKREERWIVYDLDGFQEWRKDKQQQPEPVTEKTPYGGTANPAFRYVDRHGQPALPIFFVELPTRGHTGYMMARKDNAILNQENALDYLLFVACFPKFFADTINPITGVHDSDVYTAITKAFREGSNLIPGNAAGHRYDAPPTGPAEIKRQVLQDKIEAFFATFFQQYGDAARERTATEIRQDFRAGIEAFLHLFAKAADELENGVLFRLEQAEAAGPLWPAGAVVGEALVERSRDFRPVDLGEVIEGLVKQSFGDRLPLDKATALRVAVRYLEERGVVLNEDEQEALRADVERSMDLETVLRLSERGFPLEEAARFVQGGGDLAALTRTDFVPVNGVGQ